MKRFACYFLALAALTNPLLAGPYAPAAGQVGSTAIPAASNLFVGWATSVTDLNRGPISILDPGGDTPTWGTTSDVLGIADAAATNLPVLSLGDGGSITLSFAKPITNGTGADFAVFENGLSDYFLELAFVEVSSNGTNFVRFDSYSQTQSTTQVGSFDLLDPTNIHNLAGKYRAGYGMPFDLAELNGKPGLNINAITHVRIVDVVGTVDPDYARRDSLGRIINDPWPTDFETGGFDLDAVGVIHQAVPEPGSAMLIIAGLGLAATRRKRR
jgi:hypothetical protein